MSKTNGTDWELQVKMSFAASFILIMLPVSAYVLYSGLLRWRQQRSISHSDFFTYNMALMELIGALGYLLVFFTEEMDLVLVVGSFPWYGETVFPVYTSVEQYLAALHPITYLGLKRGKGLWVRYAGSAFVWLLCTAKIACLNVLGPTFIFACDVTEIASVLVVMVFCSSSVLRVLRRPKPGDRTTVDKSKQRAFFLLLSITVVLVFRFSWDLLYTAVCSLSNRGTFFQCFVLREVQNWVNLATSLVMPLLYLQRAGKLC